MKSYHLGLDLGGTKFSGILLDNDGRELLYREVPVRSAWKARELFGLLVSLTQDIAARARIKPKHIKTAGIGVPGIIGERGRVMKAVNLPALERVHLPALLPSANTTVYNDTVCACYAESVLGKLAHAPSGALLMLGTGLGGAAMSRLDDSGIFGKRNVLEIRNIEIGNIAANIEAALTGPLAEKPYELEAYCSRKFFIRNSDMHIREIYEEYLAGDPGSRDLFMRYGVNIGSLLATVETIYRPHTIVLGGGMTAYFPAYEKTMKRIFHERRFLPYRPANIQLSAFGPEVGALGAALYGMLK